jgi:hypothetical protein
MPAIAFLTQHAKQSAVEAPLKDAGYTVHTIAGFDTDAMGTFTGETARKGTQLDAAVAKAQLATTLSGQRYGLGSEGSFGPDPHIGLTAWASEVLAWWDVQAQRLIYAVVQGPETNYDQTTAATWDAARAFASSVGFEPHGIIVGKPGQTSFNKDCNDWATLEEQVREGLTRGPVWLETDMRAHRNPTRMAMIRRCTEQLAALLQNHCPACSSIGFGEVSPVYGARCEECGGATTVLKAKVTRCTVCNHSTQETLRQTVPPARCHHCNP